MANFILGGPISLKLGRSSLQSILSCGRGMTSNSSAPKFSIMQRTFCLSASAQHQDRNMQKSSIFQVQSGAGNLMTKNNSLLVTPKRLSSTGDHVRLWTAEKVVSAAFLPILPLAFIFPSAGLDYLLAFTITIHSHWGIEAIVIDYVRPSIFGPVVPKIALGLVYGLSALTLGGLFYFIYSDVGLVNAIKMLWKL